MHALYKFVSGPLVWVAFGLFVGGCCYRVFQLVALARRKEKFIFSFFSFRYSLRSIVRWLIPYATVSMRNNPVMTAVAFAFHISLLLVPVFLLAHIVLWEEAWDWQWWALPDGVADVMTLIVIAACAFFIVRRMRQPEVRYVTSASDYVILAIVAAPFITGFYCSFNWPGYQPMVIAHVLSGEIMLAAIPFTRLIHMIFAVFTRGYTGSEFGGVRHARDW
jgi:nitrate reductase gamma subunit